MSREKNQEYLDKMCYLDENGNPLVRKCGFYMWISLKDRLPPENAHILIYGQREYDEDKSNYQIFLVAFYKTVHFHGQEMRNQSIEIGSGNFISNFTYWMPLPNPPQAYGMD